MNNILGYGLLFEPFGLLEFFKIILYRIQHWFASQCVKRVQKAEEWGRKKQLNVACADGIDLFDRLGFSGELKTWP